jgi:putrescine transport system substrate-binding protein
MIGRLAAKLLLAAVLSFPIAAKAQQDLRIYNWADYVDPTVLDAFTAETGIRVVYDTFDQMEAVDGKLAAGKTGFDLVVVSASFLPRHIPLKLYAELDKSKVPNLKNLWPEIAQRLARFDPGNRYAVDYMWGTTGIGYNVAKIRERLGGDAKVDSWAILFDPARLAKVADCGVHILDNPDELFAAALRYLGMNPDSKNQADLDRAAALLQRMRPHIRKFHSSDYVNALANGEICMAFGTSGDVLQARRRAREAGNGIDIAYAIPREGANMWFDCFVILADAEHKDAALKFIDFMNRPEIAAKNSNFVQYPNGNLASQKLLDPAVRNDPAIYPAPETMARLYTITPFDEKTQRVVARMWTRVKTGK